jgi:hypothetical protein
MFTRANGPDMLVIDRTSVYGPSVIGPHPCVSL